MQLCFVSDRARLRAALGRQIRCALALGLRPAVSPFRQRTKAGISVGFVRPSVGWDCASDAALIRSPESIERCAAERMLEDNALQEDRDPLTHATDDPAERDASERSKVNDI